MATLFRKPTGIWYINYSVNGKRFKQSTGTNDKKLAQVKLDDLKVKLFKGEMGIPRAKASSVTIADFFRRFRDYCKNNYAPEFLQSDLSRINIWQDYFARQGIRRLTDITPNLVDGYMNSVLSGRKPKTRKNHLSLLKTMLNYAVKWELIEINSIAKIKPPKIIKTFRFFDKKEMRQILKEADEPLKTGIILLVNTGLRRSELYNLRWKDVDLKNKQIRVWPYEGFTPKSKKPRTIPMNSEVLTIIKNLRDNQDKTDYVFRPYNCNYHLREKFVKLLKSLGFKGTLHDLRHTFASHLAMAGTPIPAIKELLGHSDISTTMIYSHLSPGIHQAEVEKIKF